MFGLLGQRLAEARVHQSAPLVLRRVRLALAPPVHLAADQFPACGKPIDLIRRRTGSRRHLRDDGAETVFRRIEDVLAKWARRLQGAITGAQDHPFAGEHRMALDRCALKQVGHERTNTAGVDRVIDPRFRWHRELAPNRCVWKQSAVDRVEGDR